jgi:hypothetical protein
MIRITLCFSLLLASAIAVSAAPASIRLVDNHKNWGWKAYVLNNGLVTAAVVPDIGGRVMQYDLGDHPSIYVNPAEFGKVYTPSEDSPWYNYGGYKTWPAPQSYWLRGMGGWPPAPNLDFGRYMAKVERDTPDSVVLWTESSVETFAKWNSIGLKLTRRYTLYHGTSRIRVEQGIINTGATHAIWGVWDITQSIVNHEGEQDWDNFWVYFPVRPNSAFGEKGFYVMGGDNKDGQWGHVPASDIRAVQYLHHTGKVGADSDGGWVCYVDERDGYAYAKRFPYFPNQTYPDGNASVEIFTAGDDLPYLEVEVLSPLVNLVPQASYTFTENWYAAKVDGPILNVNDAGATKWRLTAKKEGEYVRLEGAYGIFYVGTVRVVWKDTTGKTVSSGATYTVSPLKTFVLGEKILPPAGATKVDLEVYNEDGKLVSVLDSTMLPR